MLNQFNKKFCIFILILSYCLISLLSYNIVSTYASMPFYDLCPKNLTLRSKFYTSFSTSSEERKHNIKTASATLDKTFVDVGGEFSFNRTVGERTEKRGYKTSKIIAGGEFIDGVGGGVCQVSTTLYNALLLSGLKIIEYHPHSLAVSYVAPSFDAMVSYNFADLKFINNTHNPIIIHTIVANDKLTVEIYGEPNDCTYSRLSVTVGELPAPAEDELLDQNGEYPDLFIGQRKVIRYSKAGLKSEGYLTTIKNGKAICTQKIRTDNYKSIKGLIVLGNTPIPEEITEQESLSPE